MYLLVEGLREEDRAGTGIEQPFESTSMLLFERGTVFTDKSCTNIDQHQRPDVISGYVENHECSMSAMNKTHHLSSNRMGWDHRLKTAQEGIS